MPNNRLSWRNFLKYVIFHAHDTQMLKSILFAMFFRFKFGSLSIYGLQLKLTCKQVRIFGETLSNGANWQNIASDLLNKY